MLSYRQPGIDYTEADSYITRLKQRLMKRPRFEEEVTHWALDVMESEDGIIESAANIPNEEEKIKELIGLVDEGPDRKFDTLIRAIEQIRRENMIYRGTPWRLNSVLAVFTDTAKPTPFMLFFIISY